ncbi:uncharacterized protein LOC101860046 isoform X4 [Aplysia californica]|uniref:Uncharacterized protein LOC101860046 isoform X4 n=1 Tax=Aplysia californica TaxID=6500 RepID=A0ABM1A8R9_APLCA|nr:uncharacterized protein LOC101860046 isoform X4 [Aplysia californica]
MPDYRVRDTEPKILYPTEMVMMVDIPTHINIGRGAQEDSFVQILGLSSDRPLVKVNNQVLAGEVITALGSDLLLEIETSTVPSANKDSQNTTIKKVKDVIVTDKRLNMDPVYLESKKPRSASSSEPIAAAADADSGSSEMKTS